MLQVAFDAASEAMVIVDVDRRIHWANQASADLFVGGVPIQLVNQTLADVLKLRPLEPMPRQPFNCWTPNILCRGRLEKAAARCCPQMAMNPRCSCCVGGLWN